MSLFKLAVISSLCCACSVGRAVLLPHPDVVYRVPRDLGFDELNLAVALPSDRQPTRLELELSSMRRVVAQVRLDASSLVVNENRIEHLHFVVPSAAAVDALSLSASDATGVFARSQVPVKAAPATSRYRLPLEGCWRVNAGHDFGLEHRRWYSRAHFAWDFGRLSAAGLPAVGRALADYPAFGAPVVAPADGRVLVAIDTFPDRAPGDAGPSQEANLVLIDHGGGERSRLMHLAQGSLEVKPGDLVRSGQRIGRVGNSGRSDEPHLHLHFETSDAPERPLPLPLAGYWVAAEAEGWRQVSAGRPRAGQIVCSAGPTSQ